MKLTKILYLCLCVSMIVEEESTNMNFLELAGNLEGEDDLEILEELPAKMIAPMAPPEKCKGTSTVPSKRKVVNNVSGAKKLMPHALRTRSSKRLANIEIIEAKEAKKNVGSGISVGTSRAIGPNLSLKEKTMLLAPDERAE